MFGRRAATTADNARTRIYKFRRMRGKLCGGQIVTAVRTGKPRIRFCNKRQRCIFPHFGNNGEQFIRSYRAVDAYRVCAESRKRDCRRRHVATRKRSSVFLKSHCHKNGKRRILLCGNKSGFCLVKIHHRFDEYKVCTRLFARRHLNFEIFDRGLKGQRAERFEKFAERTYVKRHFSAERFRGFFCGGNGSKGRFFATHAAVLHFRNACPESIRKHYLRTRLEISAVNIFKYLRIFRTENARIVTRFHSPRLKHRTHCAVKKNQLVKTHRFPPLLFPLSPSRILSEKAYSPPRR